MLETIYTQKQNPVEALAEIRKGIKSRPKFITFFASTKYDLENMGKGLETSFPGATIIGCSTAGELITGHMLKDSVVAMAMDEQLVSQVAVEVIPDLAAADGVANAFASLEKKLGCKLSDLDMQKYAGLILIDGLRAAEERIMDAIGNLSDLTWIGGSAGDDLKFKETRVFAKGQSRTNAAVLALIRLDKGFDIIKTQSFDQTGKRLKATEVNEANRTVTKFNDQPAAKAYAAAIGYPLEKVSDGFMRYPVGVMVDGEPFVRSPQRLENDKMVFYCNIKQGTELSILESRDIVKDTSAALADMTKALGQVSGIINFNCILRTLELDAKRESEAYGQVFAKVPMVGFSTYGEEYIGHINQTATMLVLK
jgi:hypothetical protein